jgi:alkaline phosphatase
VLHWGSDPANYVQWGKHSNKLIPVYAFGTAGAGEGIDLESYRGARSPYRSESALRRLYGRVPAATLNPAAEYFDQTNVYDIQRAALAAGKKRIILVVFDGMGWETTRAAAIAKTGVVYREGRGAGLFFQDYTAGGTSQYGLVVTSPYGDQARFDVDLQSVASSVAGGGYDPARAGPTPWSTMPDREYVKGDAKKKAHVQTDSSASATSLCSGIKTYNLAINVAPDGRQVETIAHQAQRAGYAVGAVTSVPISHATPASAYAHNVTRADYQDLTRDLLGLPSASHPGAPLPGLDVVMGAGWGAELQKNEKQGLNFVPGNVYLTAADRRACDVKNGGKYVVAERTRGRRGVDVLAEAVRAARAGGERLLCYFGVAKAGDGHLPFRTASGDYLPALDRGKKQEIYSDADIRENPTLADLAGAALDHLGDKERFWLMIEAGDVDWANHANNIDSSIGAVFSGDDAVRVAATWIEKHGGWKDAVMIVTSDHDHYLVLEDPAALAKGAHP